MRDAEAWCAAGIVGPGRPLLVTSSALPMMLGLILFLLVHGSMTYGWRGALGFFACGTRWRSRSRRRPSRRGSPSASSPTTGRSGVLWHPAHGAALAGTLGGACLAEMGPAQRGDILFQGLSPQTCSPPVSCQPSARAGMH